MNANEIILCTCLGYLSFFLPHLIEGTEDHMKKAERKNNPDHGVADVRVDVDI